MENAAVPSEPTVHVIATSLEGTRAALDVATALARALSARVALFIPCTAADGTTASLRRLTESYAPRPRAYAYVSEHTTDVVQLLRSPGIVVIGGHARSWWPTAEERLARDLAHLGCHVTFVHVPHGQFVSPLVSAIREEALCQ